MAVVDFLARSFLRTTGAPDRSRIKTSSELDVKQDNVADSKKIKLVGIGTVKNEADVIESFVRHNLSLLDLLVLVDDGSVDGTKEILFALEAEGLNLITLDWDGSAGYEQSLKLSELLLVLTSRGEFDWVFPLDADEAIDCASRATLERALQQVGKGQIGAIPWRTFIPTTGDDWSQLNPFLRIVNRREQESPQYYKIAVPVNQMRLEPIVIATGSHKAQRAVTFKPLLMAGLEGVTLAHFPVRTPEQLVRKVIAGWLATIAEGPGRPSRCFHWRDMYAQFIQKGVPNCDELERLAQCYSGQTDGENFVRSPLRVAHRSALRHSKNNNLPIFVTLARTAEEIIAQRKGLKAVDHFANASSHRAAWRHRATLFDSIRSGQESAIADYLDRRFGPDVPFVDEEFATVLPKTLAESVASPKNRVKSIVLIGRKNRRAKFRLESRLKDGWVVDRNATLAVRLLARSTRVRRNSVVIVRCDTYGNGHANCDHIPGPSTPAWWENLRRTVLRCHLLLIKLYWFFYSTFCKT